MKSPWLLLGWLLAAVAGPASSQVPAVAIAAADPQDKTSLNELYTLVHRLTLRGNAQYYGAASVFRVDGGQAYLLTNAHLIPQTPDQWARFRVEGVYTHDIPLEASLVGVDAGLDIAVLAISFSGFDPPMAKLLRELPQRRLSEQMLKSSGTYRSALIGFEYLQASPLVNIQGLSWVEEANYYALAALNPSTVPETLSRNGAMIGLSTRCPELLALTCYRARLRSWGFSGGLLITDALSARTEEFQAIGLVSHFSPLGNETWALPLAIALPAAQAIVDQKKTPVDGRADDFEWVSEKELRLKSGPLTKVVPVGSLISARQALAPGGGDLAGGGGDLAGGGGDLAGGGGVLEGADIRAEIHPPTSMDESLQNPDRWIWDDANALRQALFHHRGFKKVQSLLSFLPGLRIQNKLVYGLQTDGTDHLVNNLQEFLSLVRAVSPQSSLKLIYDFPKLSPPKRLGSLQPGVMSAMLLRPSGPGSWIIADPRKSLMGLGGMVAVMDPQSITTVAKNETLDLGFFSSGPGDWTQVGPQVWMHSGAFTFMPVGGPQNGQGRGASGLMYLQFDSEKNAYEMKQVLAMKMDNGSVSVIALSLDLINAD